MSTQAQHPQDSEHWLRCEWAETTMTKMEDVKWWQMVHIKAAWVFWVNSMRANTSRMRTKVRCSLYGPYTVLRVSSALTLNCGYVDGIEMQKDRRNYWNVQRNLIYIKLCKILLFEQGLILVPHCLLCDVCRNSKLSKSPGEATLHPVLTTFRDSRGHSYKEVRVGDRSSVSGNRDGSLKHSAECLAPSRWTTNLCSLGPICHSFFSSESKDMQLLLREG